MVNCAQTGVPILAIYTSCDVFLRQELDFVGRDDCTWVKFLLRR